MHAAVGLLKLFLLSDNNYVPKAWDDPLRGVAHPKHKLCTGLVFQSATLFLTMSSDLSQSPAGSNSTEPNELLELGLP